MGKIPPGFRRAASQSPVNTLLKNNVSSHPLQQIPLKTYPNSPKKKPIKNNVSTSNTHTPPISFDSPKLSDAKSLFNSLVSTNKNPPSDSRFYNSILESFSSISSMQDIFFPSITWSRNTLHSSRTDLHIMFSLCSLGEHHCTRCLLLQMSNRPSTSWLQMVFHPIKTWKGPDTRCLIQDTNDL